MFKKIALLLGLMTSMLFSLSAQAAVDATDPNALVDQAAKQTFASVQNRYPIVLTRSVPAAKTWLKTQARGSERYGMVVFALLVALTWLLKTITPLLLL